jgi:hypothetical protein
MEVIENAGECRLNLLKEQRDSYQKQIDELELLIQKYPSVQLHKDRWERCRYYTSEVNSLVDKVQIMHNCGCCDDSPLEVWPCLEVEGIPIFASGIPYTVGYKNYYNGEMPIDGWQNKFITNNINPIIIEKIQKYFDEHPVIEESPVEIRFCEKNKPDLDKGEDAVVLDS